MEDCQVDVSDYVPERSKDVENGQRDALQQHRDTDKEIGDNRGHGGLI